MMNRPAMKRAAVALALLITASAGVHAQGQGQAASAQSMADPTRPPADYLPAAAGKSPDSPAAGQILVISQDRKFATINGETVALGGLYRDGRVIGISDEGVVLQRRSGTETIKLYSSVNKTMRRTDASATPSRTTPQGRQVPR